MYKRNTVQMSLLPINLNARWGGEVWMAQCLRIYYNSEYVYAISPIALRYSGIMEVGKLPRRNRCLLRLRF